MDVVKYTIIDQNLEKTQVGIRSLTYELKFNQEALKMLHAIVFKNYYTTLLNVSMLVDGTWNPIISDYRLMEHSDCEEESEKFVVIFKSKMNLSTTNLEKVERLKFIMTQPSQVFTQFKVNQLTFYVQKANTELDAICPMTCFKTNLTTNSTLIISKDEVIDVYLEMLNDPTELNINFID